jgi:hypothetical protein
MILVKN